MIAHIITPTTITLIIDAKDYLIKRNSKQAEQILTELRKKTPSKTTLKNLADTATAVTLYADKTLVIMEDGTITKNGEPLPDVIAQKVMACFKNGVPFANLANFFQRLEANPSRRAVKELYEFLAHQGMPITPEGFILGYKGVNANYKDKYSNTFLNKPGCVLEMKRNEVNDDMTIGCAEGFHAGSYEYAKSWATGDGHLMIVEIDPKDVVSIPQDCSFQKLRCCKYTVLCESKGKLKEGSIADRNDPYGSQIQYEELLEPTEGDQLEFNIDWRNEICKDDTILEEAYEAGAKRASDIIKKSGYIMHPWNGFTKDTKDAIRKAYGGSYDALDAFIDGFQNEMATAFNEVDAD